MLAKPETLHEPERRVGGASWCEKYEAQPEQDLVVLYDELDLPFGTLRVRPRGRSAGHNGMRVGDCRARIRRRSRGSGWELGRIIR